MENNDSEYHEAEDQDFEPKQNNAIEEQLDELFYSWSGTETEDDVEYRWPNNLAELNQSEKILRKLNKQKDLTSATKARIEDYLQIVKSGKKGLPNRLLDFTKAFAIALVGFLAVWYAYQFDLTPQEAKYEAKDWTLARTTKLESDVSFAKQKYTKTLQKGTKLKPLYLYGLRQAIVETPAGERGFVDIKDFVGAKTIVLTKNMRYFAKGRSSKAIGEFEAGTQLTVINHKYPVGNSTSYLVRSPKGKQVIMDWWGNEMPFMDGIPQISTSIIPLSVERLESMKGKTLQEVENELMPAFSVFTSQKVKRAFFYSFNLNVDDKKYKGVYLHLDKEEKILGHELKKKSKDTDIADSFPLSDFIRNHMPPGIYKYSSSIINLDFEWLMRFKDKAWWAYILGLLLQIVMYVVVYFVLLAIPRLVVGPIFAITTHTKLNSTMVLGINLIVYVTATYYYLLWISLLSSSFLFPFIFGSVVFYVLWKMHKLKINYNRCPNCGNMNAAIDMGSTYRGRSKNVSYGTEDVYSHSSTSTKTKNGERVRQTTHYYDRVNKKTTTETDHFDDQRQCVCCGYDWDVSRSDAVSSVTEKA